MPTVRYQIRNEYGLADPELYRAADKDDPEAILEGVAMAGLVGVLRQIGDLAEFAAEIFRDLHEEVTATAARGHGLLLRVQQLEAEFPSTEKAFLIQPSHSHFAYNDGIDWHTNLRMDQNLVTQGDMPRFILDSYEECRGPPRLFMLDKFDVAGAGACLKRYSDPSFFKVEFASSGLMEEEVQWEKKARKIRKKASRGKNGEIIESFLAPLINSNLQPENSDQVTAKVPARRVKLKSRNLLHSDITNRKSYMEHLLHVQPPEEKVCSENSIRHPMVIIKSIDSSGLTPQVPETVINTIADSMIERETNATQSPTRKEMSYIPTNELKNHKVKSVEMLEAIPKKKMSLPEIKTEVSFDGYMSDKAEKSPTLLEVHQRKPFTDGEFSTEGGFGVDTPDGYRSDEAQESHTTLLVVDPKKSLAYAEFTPKGEYDVYKSDDIGSDLENYMDALNTIESDAETDSEHRAKLDPGFSNMGAPRIDSHICEQYTEFPSQPSEPDSGGKSTASTGWNSVTEHHPGNSLISGDLTDTQQLLEHVSGFCLPANEDNFLKESHDKTLDELQVNAETRECKSSVHFLPNETCSVKGSDVASIKSEVGESSSGSSFIGLMSSHTLLCPQESNEAQSVTSLSDEATGYAEGTHVVSQQLDHKVKFPEFANNADNVSGESIPLSEMGDFSLERKDVAEGIYPAECAEEQISEDMSDHLPETKDENAFEEISAQYIGESAHHLTQNSAEREESVKEEEACLDGSVSPNIPQPSPETCPVAQPKVLAAAISGNDAKWTYEVERDLDGTLPNKDEMGFAEPIINSRILPVDLLPSSNIPCIINPTDDVEPVSSEDIEGIQGKTIPEDIPFEHVEEPPVLTVQLGASQDPMAQDNRTSQENMCPTNPALSLSNNQFTMQPDVFSMGVRNFVTGVKDTGAEGMEERKALSPHMVSLELEYFSDVEEPQESHELSSAELSTVPSGKGALPDDMQLQLNSSAENAGKSNILMPNIKPIELEHFSDVEMPQESRDADSIEHLPLDSTNALFSADMQLQNEEPGFMMNSDAEELASFHAASMKHLPLDSASEIVLDDIQVLNKERGLMMKSDADDPKESPTADSAEHFPLDSASDMFPDDMQLQNKELGCVVIDGAEPVADTLGLPGGSVASNLHNSSLHLENHPGSDGSLDEYVIVEADDNNQGTSSVYSVKAPGFDVQLQENYLPHDADLDQQDMEAKVSLQNESDPIFSNSELPILHRPNPSDAKLLDSVCTIPSQPHIDKENLVCSSENDDSGSKEGIFPSSLFLVQPKIPPGEGSESNLVCSHQEGEHLESSHTEFQTTCTNGQKPTQSISGDIADQPAKPEPCDISSGKTYELDVSLSNVEVHEEVEDEASAASGCSSEISVASLVSSIPAAGLPAITRSTQAILETSLQEASITNSSQAITETSLQEASIASSGQAISEIFLQKAAIADPREAISEVCLQEAAIASSTQAIAETSLQGASMASSSQAISETCLQKAASANPNQAISEASLQEVAIASFTQAIVETSLQEASMASSSQAFCEIFLKETSEPWSGEPTSSIQSQDVVETPPLPPLPPVEWRLGKVRLGPLTSSGDTIQPQLMTNPFMEQITGDEKYPQGQVAAAVEMVQPENCFLTSLPVLKPERFQHEFEQPSRLSELPLIADEERQHRSLILEREITNSSHTLVVVSDTEDGKFTSDHIASVPALEDWRAQHPQLSQKEWQHSQHRRPQLGHLLPNLELERSQCDVSSVARDSISQLNPFFVGSSTEEWKHQYGYGIYGGESVQHLNFSAPLAAGGPNMPPYGFLYSMGENPSTIYDFMIPTMEGEKPNWTYRSIRDRPRDPLIEAVAAHDKSTLRKVSELDRPSVQPKADERDSLLEQIRNKSFNLKPANAPKPNIKGVPQTNLKVAAILEKANAIRQACVGSDEDDDDGDTWSDS